MNAWWIAKELIKIRREKDRKQNYGKSDKNLIVITNERTDGRL